MTFRLTLATIVLRGVVDVDFRNGNDLFTNFFPDMINISYNS